jgi:hypothetical protein
LISFLIIEKFRTFKKIKLWKLFFGIRDTAFFWSATEFDGSTAWSRYLGSNFGNVNRDNTGNKSLGASVRCLRD